VNKLLDRHFSKPLVRSAKSTTNNFFKEDSISPRVKLHYKNVSQAQLAMGFVGAAGTDPNYWPQVILQIVLGGGMSSRLFVKVRERLGLAYVIRSSIRGHQDNSLFSIEAGLKKDKIDLAYKTIIAELKSLTKEKICQAELAKAKDYLQGKMALAFEESSEYIFWLLEQYINDGEVKTFAAVKEKINKVTAAEVRLAAQSLFKPEKLNLAIIGPYKDSLYFNKLINRYKYGRHKIYS
jgi:predicted Zn-dependent peptidase